MIALIKKIFKRSKDKALINLVNSSYKSLRVVGRGTIRICPKEVRESPEFQKALLKAKEIVENIKKDK